MKLRDVPVGKTFRFADGAVERTVTGRDSNVTFYQTFVGLSPDGKPSFRDDHAANSTRVVTA